MDQRCTTLARLHGKAKADRMRFRHIRTHDQDAIAVLQVFLKTCGRAATE
jgi:hypothetical protein